MPHGYRGAQEISMMFDTVFGWSAAADNITAADFRGLEQLYLQTPRMKEFLGKENPWALHHICERLLEVADRGMWEAEAQDLDEMPDLGLPGDGRRTGGYGVIEKRRQGRWEAFPGIIRRLYFCILY